MRASSQSPSRDYQVETDYENAHLRGMRHILWKILSSVSLAFHLPFKFTKKLEIYSHPGYFVLRSAIMLTNQVRKWHRWISIVITLPFLITLITGITLATRGFNTWVQPNHPPIKSELKASFSDILESARSIPEAQIKTWADVSQIDIRPDAGNIRVRSKQTQWEIQIDGQTAKVVGHGIRRFSWLVAIHEGAYFGPIVRYGIFFPSALGVFFLLLSGIILYLKPYLKRRKKGNLS